VLDGLFLDDSLRMEKFGWKSIDVKEWWWLSNKDRLYPSPSTECDLP
jgi:hypothetical protein